jgi:hypothetical protein
MVEFQGEGSAPAGAKIAPDYSDEAPDSPCLAGP